MPSNGVLWFIAIIVSTKSCVTSYEFPALSFDSITKPIQYFYQSPLSAFHLLKQANPLNYLVSTHSPVTDNPNTSHFRNNTLKSSYTSKIKTTNYQNSQNFRFDTSSSHKKTAKSVKLIQNFPTTNTEDTTTRLVQRLPVPKYDADEPSNTDTISDRFMQIIQKLDSKFYHVTSQQLLSISPPERSENGISFAQSGFFLYLQLVALCTESDELAVMEIKQSLEINTTCADQVHILRHVLSTLPKSSDFLKFRWSSRLVTGSQVKVGEKFLEDTAPALQVLVDQLNNTYGSEDLSKRLNQMVEIDSGGAMHNTFETEELSNGVCAAWLTTIYLRARWRSAPTVLNDSWLFYDGDAPTRPVRMIRINDVMRHVRLDELDAEAIEIRYAAPELTFMILMPRGRSLRKLAETISADKLNKIYEKMHTRRVAAVLPIYTLRMTLLLPKKLQMMGISKLVDTQDGAKCQSLKLSHSVQRIMFWAEAGRNAFKDDGIEWDEAPESEIVVDRPYIFFVRWRNITLLSGNFVL